MTNRQPATRPLEAHHAPAVTLTPMFAILNVETGDFYSESPALKNEARRTGRRWGGSSILPDFARRYTRYKDALHRSQKLSDQTGCVCAVLAINETVSV